MLSTIPSSQAEKKKSKSNNSSDKETLSTSTAIAEDSSGVGSNVLMNNEESKPNVEKRQRLRDVSIRSTIFTNKQTISYSFIF